DEDGMVEFKLNPDHSNHPDDFRPGRLSKTSHHLQGLSIQVSANQATKVSNVRLTTTIYDQLAPCPCIIPSSKVMTAPRLGRLRRSHGAMAKLAPIGTADCKAAIMVVLEYNKLETTQDDYVLLIPKTKRATHTDTDPVPDPPIPVPECLPSLPSESDPIPVPAPAPEPDPAVTTVSAPCVVGLAPGTKEGDSFVWIFSSAYMASVAIVAPCFHLDSTFAINRYGFAYYHVVAQNGAGKAVVVAVFVTEDDNSERVGFCLSQLRRYWRDTDPEYFIIDNAKVEVNGIEAAFPD
ncbi:hypothetical protein KIPB_015114, partial [Kipferlia bialata]